MKRATCASLGRRVRGHNPCRAATIAAPSLNSPAMIFRHYRELVRAVDAKAWFGITPKQAANVVAMEKAA